VKILKQGVCLALISAGVAMAPSTMADASAPAARADVNAHPGQLSQASGKAVDQQDGQASRHLPLSLGQQQGRQAFLLVLHGRATSAVYDSVRSDSTAAAASTAAKSRKTAIAKAQDAVIAKLPSHSNVLYRTHAALAGLAVTTDAANLGKLKGLAGVASVHPIANKSLDNAYAIPFQGGAAAWEAHGSLGNGVKVGIIDTGIDYTHANFGGEGTSAAFDAAQAADGADPNFGHPTDKVVGGFDFAGDDYNADDATPIIAPDPYPLDCNGHGSHVAGTAAGLGVNGDGSTYHGAYDASTDFDSMRIGPGMAPKAKLYGFRVFGCEGTTNLVTEAIDRAVDPNDDGDPSDHVDVINMSLGSEFGGVNDGDTVAATAAAAAGVLVANSAGNSGDAQDVSGSPGNAPTSITSANSVDAFEITDSLSWTDNGAPHTGSASRAVLYTKDWDTDDLVGNIAVLPPRTADANGPAETGTIGAACLPLTANQVAAVTGKVALVKWTQAALECGSIARGANLRVGGAVGFIFANSEEHADAGINGDTLIPGVLLAKSAADEIKSELGAGHAVVATGTEANGFSSTDEDLNDTVNTSSSRGIHAAGNVKPDIAAVGTSVFSTGSGTGDQGVSFSGTSMASPMVAGSAALVIQRHPSWTPEQVKAALMNTAGNDLHVNPDPGDPGDTFAPNRVGAGRLQVDDSLDTDVIAYNSDDHGVVSVSFGPVEVSAPTTLTKHIKVENTGTHTHTYSVSYDAITSVPGVTYTVAPSTVTLASGASATVTVTLNAPDPTVLTKAIDPTAAGDDPAVGLPQESLADASGRVLLEPTVGGGPDLRVPVYAAPRPASTLTQESKLLMPTGTDTGTLHLTGADLGSGTHNGGTTPDPADDIFSLAAGFELSAKSGVTPACSATVVDGCWRIPEDKAADVKYVGVTSDFPQYGTAADSQAYIAISTNTPWSTPASNAEFDVLIDTDGNHQADLVMYNYRLYNGVNPSDVMVSELVNLHTGVVIDDELLYNRFGDTDVAAFDSDTLFMPLWLNKLTALGINAANPSINFGVVGFSFYSDQAVDYVGVDPDTGALGLKANLYEPAIQVTDSDDNAPLMADEAGGELTVTRDADSYAADGGLGILIAHLHNKVGNKAQVVDVVQQSTVTGVHTPEPSTFGTASSVAVTVTGGATTPTGSVSVKEGATTLGSGTLDGAGKATVALPATLSVGAHALTVSYDGDATHSTASGNFTATVSAVPAKATTTTATAPKKVKSKKAFDVSATVASSGGSPTGTVQIFDGTKLIGTGTLSAGKVTITITKGLKKKGKHTLTVKYLGTASFLASQTTVKVKVQQKKH
jgi:subtilisin family serine protease